MNRRQFAMTAGTAGVVAALPACFWNDVYKTINQYVPVALLAFDRIVVILVEHGVDTSRLMEVINRVKAALADIQTAVLEFQNAHEHDKQTLIHAIAVALKIASERLVEFWEALKLPNEQLARTIKMLVDIIVSTLTGFISKLAPATPAGTMGFGPVPQVRSIKEFREDFNRVLRDRGEAKFAI